MKRVFAVLMGSAALAFAANRADAVAYAPGQPGERGSGFERWDANGDGVIDKAEFREMRKAMRKAHRGDRDKTDADRPARRHRGPDGPKARRGDNDMPPHRGPAMHRWWDDDGPGAADRPGRNWKGRGRPGPDAKAPREGKGRRPGRGLAKRRGGERCPACGCPFCKKGGRDRGPADFGPHGPRGPESGDMGPRGPKGREFGDCGPRCGRRPGGPGERGFRNERGRDGRGGPGFHDKRGRGGRRFDNERGRGGPRAGRGGPEGREFGPPPGVCPFCDMMMRAHGGRMPSMHNRGGPGGRDFAMGGPFNRFSRRGFAHPGRRFGQRGRAIGRRLFDRFDRNDDNFITPDEFPGRPEGFDRWDANDDGRIGKKEFKRDVKRHRKEMRRRGERGRRGPAGPDDDMPRGPHAERTRAI